MAFEIDWVKIIIPVLAGINLSAFFMYWFDKRCAIRHEQRIPNKILLGLAVCGGSLGALLGMVTFRHKTKTWYYVVTVPAMLALHFAAAAAVYIKLIK